MSTTPPTNQKLKPKPKNTSQDIFSWLDFVMPRRAITRYGTLASQEQVAQAIKGLDNHTSREVTIAKRKTPQGLVYSFRVEFRKKVEITVKVRRGMSRHTERRPSWETVNQINGTIKAGSEGDYPTIIEFTPERLATALAAIAGLCVFLFLVFTVEMPAQLRTLLLIVIAILAGTSLLVPYLFITYGPQDSVLEQRMEDVMRVLQAEKIEDANPAPKPKRRAAPKPKTDEA